MRATGFDIMSLQSVWPEKPKSLTISTAFFGSLSIGGDIEEKSG
jgi:hypothetical protein